MNSVQTIWNQEGRFIPNTTIKVRKSPSMSSEVVEKGSWLNGKNDWVDVAQFKKDTKNKLWWGKFKFHTNPSTGYIQCALGKIADKKESIKSEKMIYGTVKCK